MPPGSSWSTRRSRGCCSWVLVWGWFGYHSMPQRKDPDIPVRVAVASCSWPGATAQQVEQFVTRPIEDAVAENKTIHPGTASDYGVRSVSLPGSAYVYVQLAENVSDVKRQFSDINLKLNALNTQLPQGAGPISFQSDFGDTAALMLTIASPKADQTEINIRAHAIQSAIESLRAKKETHRTRCANCDRLFFPSVHFPDDDARRSPALRATSRGTEYSACASDHFGKWFYCRGWCFGQR